MHTVRTGTLTKTGMDISDAEVIVKKQQLKSTARLVQNVMIKERYQCVRKG